MDISFDSTLIATSAYDGYVRLWDMCKATCLKTLVADCGSTTPVSAVKFSDNAKYVFIANKNSELGLYDLQGTQVKAYSGHSNTVFPMDLCVSKINFKGSRSALFAGSEDGRLVSWDMNSQKVILNLDLSGEKDGKRSEQQAGSVDFNEKADLLACAGSNFQGVKIFTGRQLWVD